MKRILVASTIVAGLGVPASSAVMTYDMALKKNPTELQCVGSLSTYDGSCTGDTLDSYDPLGFLSDSGKTRMQVVVDTAALTLSCFVGDVDYCNWRNDGLAYASIYADADTLNAQMSEGEKQMSFVLNQDGTGLLSASFFDYGGGWGRVGLAEIIPNPLPASALLLFSAAGALVGARRLRS